MYKRQCLYYRQYQGTLNLISLYVDDLVIAGTIDAVESVKAIMLGKYKMKDLGKIHLILGCEVLYDEATGDYSMNQRHYVIDLCKKYLPKGVNRPSDGSLHIYAHIDSDHARDLDTRRSVTACAIFGNGTFCFLGNRRCNLL